MPYKLTLVVAYGNCESQNIIREFIKLYRIPNLLGVIGPACTGTVDFISGISSAISVPIVTYAAEGGSFADRSTYPFVYRSIGESEQ